MKKFLNFFFDLKIISFVAITLPYVGFNLNKVYASSFFSVKYFSLIVFSFIILEIISKLIYFFSGFNKYITSFIFTLITILFYGYYIILLVQRNLFLFLNVADRNLIQFIFLFIVVFIYLFIYKSKSFKFINIFFIIFSVITFSNSIKMYNQIKKVSTSQIKRNYANFNNYKLSKPIILLITDEYSSPDELYRVSKDSSIYNFSSFLKTNKWVVRNSSYTYETSTIHSLSSMFNFNLSKDSNFKNSEVETLALNKLIKSKLYQNFKNSNTQVINFGIFDFGASQPLTRLYYYPKSFFEVFFRDSFYHILRIPLLNILNSERNLSYYPMEEHNKYLFNHLPDTISNNNNKNIFIYAHLFMPHSPIIFRPEIELLPNNLDNYISYWNFTNKKLKSLIGELTKDDRYRIIITGDHGFKGDKKINSKLTFSAFYGFDKLHIENTKSIQDFGILINETK
jgi:hypothetical protein